MIYGFPVFFAAVFQKSGKTGTIGAFAVLMVWLYYTSILILVGGEINSQVYNQLERKAQEIRDDFSRLK